MTKKASSVIRTYLVINGLYTLAASVIWGVNTLFLLNAGLEVFEVFLANAIFTGAMALFELPTGVAADTRGRRFSFLLSISILIIGTLGYVAAARFGGGLFWFGLISAILGLGFTFYSGALEAWLVDALAESGFSEQLDQIFARSAIFSGGAMLIGSVAGGFLGQINLAVPFLVRTGLLILVFGVAFRTVYDRGFTPLPGGWTRYPSRLQELTRTSIHYGWNQRELRQLLLAGMVVSLVSAWGFYAWQPYLLDMLGNDLTWIAGVIAALVALSTMLGNSLVAWFSRFCGRRTTLLLWAGGIIALALLAFGLADSFWVAVPFYLLASGAGGVMTPVKQGYLHQLTDSSHRATLISFDSLLSSASSMAGQSGLGYIAGRMSYSTGYITGGLSTLLVIPLLLVLRRNHPTNDFLRGSAGLSGSCPAPGLPDVAGVDVDSGTGLESQTS